MYPPRFEYHRARSIDEALGLLGQYKEEVKVLAGGQSLIPLMKLRLASPPRLLDIGRLTALAGIATRDGELCVGALSSHADLEVFSPPRGAEILREGAKVIGDPQVRNLGTVGGALAEADPAGDWGAVLLALDATAVCRNLAGERRVRITDFFLDAYTSALRPDELLTEVHVPLPAAGTGSSYLKFERKAGDFAVASAAVVVQAGARGEIAKIGIGLSGVGLKPIRATAAEQVLQGQEFNAELLKKAGEALMAEISPLSDLRGPAEYKREVAGALFRRAFHAAWERARGNR